MGKSLRAAANLVGRTLCALGAAAILIVAKGLFVERIVEPYVKREPLRDVLVDLLDLSVVLVVVVIFLIMAKHMFEYAVAELRD